MYDNILFEVNEGIALLKVNRPEAMNALNTETLLELKTAVAQIARSAEIKVVVISGGGDKAFVAGADVSEMAHKPAREGLFFALLGQSVLNDIAFLPQPTIAAVNGFALGGGCELALACDIRIAAENAKFGQPEVKLGVMPGFGGTQRLARLIGTGKAKEMIYTANIIKADEALRIGLVEHMVPKAELMATAMELAGTIAANSPIGVRQAKLAIDNGLEAGLEAGIAYEAQAFGICFSTDDQKEGMSAFLAKRTPEWKNN